jgi:hypothetical protein
MLYPGSIIKYILLSFVLSKTERRQKTGQPRLCSTANVHKEEKGTKSIQAKKWNMLLRTRRDPHRTVYFQQMGRRVP